MILSKVGFRGGEVGDDAGAEPWGVGGRLSDGGEGDHGSVVEAGDEFLQAQDFGDGVAQADGQSGGGCVVVVGSVDEHFAQRGDFGEAGGVEVA